MRRNDRPPLTGRLARAAAFACCAAAGLAALGGCGHSHKDELAEEGFTERNPIGVPAEAKLVRHSRGQGGGMQLLNPDTWFAPDDTTFRPAHDGRVWVVDELNAAVVWRGRMRSGDELVVSPRENVILLNKGSVYQRKLRDEHGFLIYFVPCRPRHHAVGPDGRSADGRRWRGRRE